MKKVKLFSLIITSIFLCLTSSCSVKLPGMNSSSSRIENISSNCVSSKIESESSINESSNLVSTSESSNSYIETNCDPLEIHFLELGNKYVGDSTFIKAGETDILIDAGSRTTSSTTLNNAIKEYCSDGILEYVIATHAHQDHIAGFKGSSANPGVLKTFKVNTFIDFPKTNSTSQIYNDYITLRDEQIENGSKHYTALECCKGINGGKQSFQIAKGITLNILYQKYYEEQAAEENDYSVCVLISQNDNHFLFTGDLEKKGEESLVQSNKLPHVKVFKGGHHGSSTSNNDVLLDAITPENICICTCAGTSEYTDTKDNQFPCQETINRFAKHTDKIYITSQVDKYVSNANWKKTDGGTVKPMNGRINVVSTYDSFSIHCSNNDIILKDTEWFKNNRVWIN